MNNAIDTFYSYLFFSAINLKIVKLDFHIPNLRYSKDPNNGTNKIWTC